MKYTDKTKSKTILNSWLKDKTIKVGEFLQLRKSIESYEFLDEFLVFAISKCNIKYKNLPVEKLNDLDFLRHVCVERTATIKEMLKANKSLFMKLLTKFDSSDIDRLSQSLAKKQLDAILTYRENIFNRENAFTNK